MDLDAQQKFEYIGTKNGNAEFSSEVWNSKVWLLAQLNNNASSVLVQMFEFI